jgi:hypothetical protein
MPTISVASRRGAFVRMFGSAIFTQALLSAMNFFIGLVLIRHTTDAQYGYYVLVANASLLLSGLQSAFVQPPLVMRLTKADRVERAEIVGGLFGEQRRLRFCGSRESWSVRPPCWLSARSRPSPRASIESPSAWYCLPTGNLTMC